MSSDDEQGSEVGSELRMNDQERREVERLTQAELDNDKVEVFAERAKIRDFYQNNAIALSEATKSIAENGNQEDMELEDMENLLVQADEGYTKIFLELHPSTVMQAGASGKELACDGEFLLSATEYFLVNLQKFRNQKNERLLKPKDFAENLVRFASSLNASQGCPEVGLDPDEDPENAHFLIDDDKKSTARTQKRNEGTGGMWEALGMFFLPLKQMPIHMDYARQLFPDDDTVVAPRDAKVKKERVKKENDVTKTVVLKEKDEDNAAEEQSVTKELDIIKKCLRKEMRAQHANQIPFYPFVLDPTDFAKSVENMFYFSFLIRDGHFRLLLGDDGLPIIQKIDDEEKNKLNDNNRTKINTHQAIFGFNMAIWKGMVRALKIEKAAIDR